MTFMSQLHREITLQYTHFPLTLRESKQQNRQRQLHRLNASLRIHIYLRRLTETDNLDHTTSTFRNRRRPLMMWMMMMMMIMLQAEGPIEDIDREFEFYEFFSFLKFNKFY